MFEILYNRCKELLSITFNSIRGIVARRYMENPAQKAVMYKMSQL